MARGMPPSLLRLVTFDITNTVIRVKHSPGWQYAYVAKQFGIHVDDTQMTSAFFHHYKQQSIKYPNFGLSVDMSAYNWWSDLVKKCFHSVDPSLDKNSVDEVADRLFIHYTTPEAWEILPGAREALEDLQKYDVQTAVISNWDHRLVTVLQALGLDGYFKLVVSSYLTGVEKPDAAIFREALKKSGCSAHSAVHFGDNVDKDFHGARNAGMESFLLKSDGTKEDTLFALNQSCVVTDAQSFVDAIRSRLPLKS